MKIDNLTNLYSVSKTLKFRLVPYGKTLENFYLDKNLEDDERRSEEYKTLKKDIDGIHKQFIDKVLSETKVDALEAYCTLFVKHNKTDEDKKKLATIESKMMEDISDKFTKDEDYKKLFGKELITDIYLKNYHSKEANIIYEDFKKFTTYLTGFNENRVNLYTGEGKSTEIAYRIIKENLPRFIENVENFKKIEILLDNDTIEKYKDYFEVSYFNYCLNQSSIDEYNTIIGGYTDSKGNKIQGINEIINLYNQSNKTKFNEMQQLYKQMLSDRNSVSFVIDKIDSDKQVFDLIMNEFEGYSENTGICQFLKESNEKLEQNDIFDKQNIFIFGKNNINWLSNQIYGDWNKLNTELGISKDCKDNIYYSIFDIENKTGNDIFELIIKDINNLITNIQSNYKKCEELLKKEYPENKKLSKDDQSISDIKVLLDSVKELEIYLKKLSINKLDCERDNNFYNIIDKLNERLNDYDYTYDKIRNYLTKKPYSDEKIKLNFNNPTFLAGWDRNKEEENSCVILKKENKYYLGVLNKNSNKIFRDSHYSENGNWQKMVYKQIPDAAKYFSGKQINPQNPPEKIKKYFETGFDKKTLNKKQLLELIDYVANDFIPNYDKLHDADGKCYFDFKFKPLNEYTSWSEFLDDINRQSYSIKFEQIDDAYVEECVNKGDLYLFQIYNKDFSEYSKGRKNLHTIYFEEIFDEVNLAKQVIRLNGGAEMFYRKSSLSLNDTAIHKANEELKNKNELNPKKTSKFEYDLIKDRRYTENQFFLHFPIKMNATCNKFVRLNDLVIEQLKKEDKHYVIGIDRGERNLVYICVIDQDGNIVEQNSLNTIINEHNGLKIKTDYHDLLDKREKELDKARKEWLTIEGIKDLKEGYISQVVNYICKLVVKYDAIIALEDLNSGFKNSRKKVEKQVYQKFENMLINKLNYLVFKDYEPNASGGVINAYQLTNYVNSNGNYKIQDGIIFYVSPWLTSKIDPSTGFVNMLYPKYESIPASKKFISKFKSIKIEKNGLFSFSFDYSDFENTTKDYTNSWTVYSYGERIYNYRDKITGKWASNKIDLTSEFNNLFKEFSIDTSKDIQNQILEQNTKEFFERIMKLISLMLQMRNSETGTDIDYIISPVKNDKGEFYCSDNYGSKDSSMPVDADANGAYHIALKALWAINNLKDDDTKIKVINKIEWLKFAQSR